MNKNNLRGAGIRTVAILMLAAGAATSGISASIGVITNDHRFGVLDDSSGAYSQISNLPIAGNAAGLALLNGLYYLEDLGSNLIRVDPLTGAANHVGSAGMHLTAMAFADNSTGLFELDRASDLYRVSELTGEATKIGATGLGPANGEHASLAGDGSSLYYTLGHGQQAAELYRIDVLTGIATDLGTTGVSGVTGSAFVDGRLELFQFGQQSSFVYTAAAGTTGFVRGVQLERGLAPIEGGAFLVSRGNELVMGAADPVGNVPEGSTFALAGIGLVCAGLAMRMRAQYRVSPARAKIRKDR